MNPLKISWSPRALNDYEEIAIYYQETVSYEIAEKMRKHLDEAVSKLSIFPMFKIGRMENMYEKSIPKTPYIIAYDLKGNDVLEIVSIIHGARNWTSESFPE